MNRFVFFLALVIALPAWPVEVVYKGRFTWHDDQPEFGGFSGLEISEDGKDFVSISDKGRILNGKISREDGVISAIETTTLMVLKDLNGNPVRRYDIDSEGLAIDGAGQIFISFESNHRIWRYSKIGGTAHRVGGHPDFKSFQNNSGMEALAVDTSGTLYTLPERSGALDKPFAVYRRKNGVWDQPFSVPRRGPFLPVGADFGPDGKFYLLERDFVWYSGFATRIRRFDVTETGMENEETLLTTGLGTHDNLEGIAAWRGIDGKTCLTMVSDDNFNFLQVTELVEYCLSENIE